MVWYHVYAVVKSCPYPYTRNDETAHIPKKGFISHHEGAARGGPGDRFAAPLLENLPQV